MIVLKLKVLSKKHFKISREEDKLNLSFIYLLRVMWDYITNCTLQKPKIFLVYIIHVLITQ